MEVKIKKLNDSAVLPSKAHISDAGFDLTAVSYEFDKVTGNYVYGTGLAFEIPEGYVGLLFPRSSISKGDLSLTNSVGVIDSHYRGEVTFKFKSTVRCLSLWTLIKFKFKRTDKKEHFDSSITIHNSACGRYEVGDRIGQMIIMPYPEIEFKEVDELSDTDRGNGGFGSSGN